MTITHSVNTDIYTFYHSETKDQVNACRQWLMYFF